MADSPTDLVRVTDPETGHQYTTSRARAEGADLKIVDRPATDPRGRVIPALPRTDKARRPVASKTSDKES